MAEYEFIVEGVIPATQEGFRGGQPDHGVRLKEKKGLAAFKKLVSKTIKNAPPSEGFPTAGPVLVVVVQYYAGPRKYKERDVDNVAKTVLDVLEINSLYKSDSQVRTLVASKRVDIKNVPQNLGYVYVKTMREGEDMKVVKRFTSRAVELYKRLRQGDVAPAALPVRRAA